MKRLRIRHSDLNETSALFSDFLYRPGALTAWLGLSYHDTASFRAAAERLQHHEFERDKIGRILLQQNEKCDLSEATRNNIELLVNKDAHCAITGHQVVTLGGPLMILFKALTVIRLSETLSTQLSHPVVPVFWLATDDHDFAEVDHILLPAEDGALEKMSYEPVAPVDGKAMAGITLDENVVQFIDSIHERLTRTEFSEDLIDSIRACYKSGVSIAEAFSRLLHCYLGKYGIVTIDPSDTELRELSKPVFAEEAADFSNTHKLIAEANESLIASDYHLQVQRDDQYLNLFHVGDKRTRIGSQGGKYFIEEIREGLSKDELLDIIQTHPERFSPNVHLRPVVQSRLLPVVAFIGGPAEVAYSAQIGRLYDAFDVVPPVVYPRLSATVVESKWKRFIEKNDIDVAALQTQDDREGQLTSLLKAKFPEGLEHSVDVSRRTIEQGLADLRKSLGDDRGLLQTFEQTRKKIDYEMNSFARKVFKAHRKANDDFSQRFRSMAEHLFPHQSLQERYCSLVYFINKYGPGFVNTVFESLDPECHDHQFIYL